MSFHWNEWMGDKCFDTQEKSVPPRGLRKENLWHRAVGGGGKKG